MSNVEILLITGKISRALHMALNYGPIDGADHKMWVIDQIVRILADDNYDKVIEERKNGKDGPDTYSWDIGIAP